MTRILFFDTETTGKAVFHKSALDDCQPRLVQLAAILMENEREMESVNILVQPPMSIPPDAAAIHGISNEQVERLGVSPTNAAYLFRDLAACSDVIVAHNLQYDKLVMTKALDECRIPPIPWEQIKQRCTMLAATPVTKLQTVRGYKWPKLEECMWFFFEEHLQGAHDALVDVRACIRVYQKLEQLGAFHD